MPKKKKVNQNERLEQELEEMKELLQRTHADFLNYKTRTDKEKIESLEYGEMVAIKELLPILDNLKRAKNHLPQELEKNEWVQGILNITKQLLQKLEEMDVREIATVGTEFDENFHEAMVAEKSKEKSGIIIEEFEPGYTYKDKVIKYAKVKIAK